MTQIVVLDGFTENPGDLSWAGLEALGQLRVYPRTKPEEIIPRIGQADIVYTNKTPITRETLLACPSIRMVSVLATGYNVVDVAACQELGILVTNIPTYGTTAVAQFTIALLLEICHQIGHHSQAVHQGRWTSSPDWCFWDYPLMELAGKTLGIIGMGRIGQAVARIAQAMGMEILAYDAHPCDAGLALAEYVPLDALLARSHVISLHCPLFPETQGVINRDTIAKMRDGVILLNTSRGPLVVDADLAEDLCLTEIRESQTNDGYMRVQVFLKNTTRSTLEIVYRFNWYDNAGAEVENPDNEMWVRKFIVAGDDVTLTSVAPGKKCRDFKLRVKAID